MFSIGLIEKIHAKSNITYVGDYYDEEDILEITSSICAHMQDIQCAEFYITGFNDVTWPSGVHWPVDVNTDLSTIIYELPIIVRDLRNNSDSLIELFEQKTRKNIEIHISNGIAELTCIDLDDNSVSSFVETLPLNTLIEMLGCLVTDFIRLAVKYCVGIENNIAFREFVCHWNDGTMKPYGEKGTEP